MGGCRVAGGEPRVSADDMSVCGGVVGHALLKCGERMTTVLTDMCRQEMDQQGLAPEERALVSGICGEVRKGFDPESEGGAPLIGVDGNVLVGHGRSSPDAIAQLIHSASTLASRNVPEALEAAFRTSP